MAAVRRLAFVCPIVWCLVCIPLVARANVSTNASAAPARIAVASAVTVGDRTVYRLVVRASGSPLVAVLPPDAPVAELIVNGRVDERAGKEVNVGSPPFGHAASALHLQNLKPSDRVEISILGRAGPPTIVPEANWLTKAFGSGLGSGVDLGILATIALFQLLAAVTMKDRTLVWYVAWVGGIFALEVARDGLFGLPPAAGESVFLAMYVASLVASLGFIVTYLQLLPSAPKLFWLLFASNAVETLGPPVVAAILHRPVPSLVLYCAGASNTIVVMAVALLRRRAGFKPASYMAVGLCGLFLIFVDRIVRTVGNIQAPFLDEWAFECGTVFDFLVFTLGLAYRARFTQREREAMEAELRTASAAAMHDQLTGLLNRRGLERYLSERTPPFGTILFVDLDGFKAVNDLGGHAAGDDTLAIVARVMSHAVRAGDAVARVGGDEFVVFLDCCAEETIARDCVARITSAIGLLRPLGDASDTRIGASIGVAMLESGERFEQALARADGDAYRVKAEHYRTSREARRLVRDASPQGVS